MGAEGTSEEVAGSEARKAAGVGRSSAGLLSRLAFRPQTKSIQLVTVLKKEMEEGMVTPGTMWKTDSLNLFHRH